MAVMIGVDPHKGSHTAVAIGVAEEPLGSLRVRACAGQAEKLVAWAQAWPERTWAVEGAGGLGHLLARSRSPLGTGRPTGCRCAATAASTTPSTWPRSPRSATGTATAAPTTIATSPRERPTRRPCAASSGGSATRSTPASKPTPARPHEPRPRAREGNRGTALTPARPAHTPQRRLFGQATPEPATTLRPAPRTGEPPQPRRSERKPGEPVDSKHKEVWFWATGTGSVVSSDVAHSR